MTDSRVPLLIGAILGDADDESGRWSAAIGKLTREAMRLGRTGHEGIVVNLVFHIDGTVLPLDFAGARTGSYFKADRVLEVQAALDKQSPSNRRTVMVGLVADAVELAEAYVIRRKLASGLPEAREVVEALTNCSL